MAFGLTFPIVSVIKFICLIKFICFVLRCLNKSLDVLKFTLSIKWIRLFIRPPPGGFWAMDRY